MKNNPEKRIHITIKGSVQGVGFRYFIYQWGVNLRLRGWVRNKLNGQVEILAEGSCDKLEVLLKNARSGPPMAQIVDVNVEWLEFQNNLPPFTILHSV